VNKRIKVIAGAAVIGLVGAGGAFAWWGFGGGGTDHSQTAANPTQSIVVTQDASTGLAPGESVNLSGKLTNPNNTDIKVGTLKAVIGVPAGVAASDFSLSGPVVIDAVVKKNAPVSWSGMTLTYANSAVSQDNAKNVPVTLTYTLTPFNENTLVGNVLTVHGVASGAIGTSGSLRIGVKCPNANAQPVNPDIFFNTTTGEFAGSGTVNAGQVVGTACNVVMLDYSGNLYGGTLFTIIPS
jgi:hypothetical protein